MKQISCFLLLLSVMFYYSCKVDKPTLDSVVIGKWDVFSAEINQRNNPLMEGGYFLFGANNELKSNVFDDEVPRTFTIENNNKLHFKGTDVEDLYFDVMYFNNVDTLKIKGKIKYYDLVFHLVKTDSK
ncbi:MAG: hypothetical protein R2774_14530 [Saprospiraceae bacterium]